MKRILSNILLVISIVGVIFSGYKLYTIFHEYHEGNVEYKELERHIKIDDKTPSEVKLDIDFNQLLAINSNCIGWIYIPNTKINYPIVQSTSNSYCLKHTFEGNSNIAGCIFISENNDNFKDKNTIIYGHNMNDGTMFTNIKNYKDQSFLDSQPYIYIAKPNGKTEKYKVFSAYTTEDGSDAYIITFAPNSFMKEVKNMINRSEVKTKDFSISDNDKIITLSTCTSRRNHKLERFVVHAIKVDTY